MSKIFLRAIVLSFLWSAPVFSQVLPFRNYTLRDGLLSNYSLCLYYGSRGYLWIGSNDGLSRYDGIAFRNYTVADGLAFSRVTCILESKKHPGTLWIGTNGGGISKLVEEHFTNYPVGSTSWSNSISEITEDYNGGIWAATAEGIFSFNDSSFVRLPLSLPRSDQEIIVALPDSSLWIVTDRRIFSYSPTSEVTHVVPITPRPNAIFEACTVDRNQNVWFTTSDGLVLKARKEKIVQSIPTGSQFHDFITEDGNGSLWAGIKEGVLRIAEPDSQRAKYQMTSYTTRNGLKENLVVDAVMDHEGDLWLAYSSAGIAKLGDYSVITYPLQTPSYPPNNTTALSDHNGHIWVCSEDGLMEYWIDASRGWEGFLHREPERIEQKNLPTSLCMDRDQTIWVTAANGTIVRYRLHSSSGDASRLIAMKEYHPGVEFPKAIPMFVFCDSNGLLWCSMADNFGVFLLNPRKPSPFVRRYTAADGLPDNSVRAIYEDRHHNLWFGGFLDGLSVTSSDRPLTGPFRLFTKKQGLPNNAIRAIMEDSLGTLWVGTRYGGLAYFQDSVFHAVSLKDGLLSTAIWCMAHGSQNRLWVGTQMGIQALIPASRTFITKQDWDGNPVYASGENSPGSLWFVSTAGLTLYDASRDRKNLVAPPVHVSLFEVNGIAFPTKGSLELSSDQDNCMIEVSGISLRDEGRLQYQYKLLGASNEEWRTPRINRTFVFASLAPGSYTFVVQAINTSGVVSAIPATLQFRILLPYWEQWWFIGGIVLGVVLLAIFVVRQRVIRLLAIERLRSDIATDLHDDIGSGLTRIAILSDVAFTQIQSGQRREGPRSDEATEVVGALEKVRTTARGLIETMSDVVWAIDPSHDSFERLVQRLRSFAYELCEGKNIKLVFHSSDDVTSAKMSSEGMRNVLLLTKEALTNIAKHSDCTTAKVSLEVVSRRLVVEITDDGRGFNRSDVHEGNGLGNMRKRTKIPGASLDLHSEPGRGTRIVASFPLLG